MDERVKALLGRVRETALLMGGAAEATARCAGKYAGQMVDIAKLNMKIFDLTADCGQLLRAAGQVVYDTHLDREPAEEVLTCLLRRLDEKHAEIAALKDRAAALRHSRECPACAALCGREDKFCRSCGAKL